MACFLAGHLARDLISSLSLSLSFICSFIIIFVAAGCGSFVATLRGISIYMYRDRWRRTSVSVRRTYNIVDTPPPPPPPPSQHLRSGNGKLVVDWSMKVTYIM